MRSRFRMHTCIELAKILIFFDFCKFLGSYFFFLCKIQGKDWVKPVRLCEKPVKS